MTGDTDPRAAIRRIPVKLATGAGDAPAYAALQITGFDADSGAITVKQPDGDSGWPILVNTEDLIPEGKFGQVTNEFPVRILYHAADGTPAFSTTPEAWGAGANSWELRKGKFGFFALGAVDSGSAQFMRAILTEAIFDNVLCTLDTYYGGA